MRACFFPKYFDKARILQPSQCDISKVLLQNACTVSKKSLIVQNSNLSGKMRNNIVDGKTESLSQITKEDRWLAVVLIKLTQQVHCDCFDLQTKNC